MEKVACKLQTFQVTAKFTLNFVNLGQKYFEAFKCPEPLGQ